MTRSLALPFLAPVLALVTALAAGCERKDEAHPDPGPKPSPSVQASAPAPEGPIGVLAPKDQLRTVHAPEGDVDKVVREAMAREAKEGRKVLVYVGATWCEPCKRFHAAANRGELDKAFPDLTLLEFDADRDGERLVTATYDTRLIPYFGKPGADGRGTGEHIEGSVKGDGAVGEITPRLQKLLGR
jgi:thiol-disulfide isomerase/thioredoxin